MQPVNHSPKNNTESLPIVNQGPFSSKTLRTTAISLITVGILITLAFTLASLVTGNMWLLPIALPGLLMIVPAVVLLIKTREKKKPITPEEGVEPKIEVSPEEGVEPKIEVSPEEEEEPVQPHAPSSPVALPSLPVKLEARATRAIFHELFPIQVEPEGMTLTKIFCSTRSGLQVCFAQGSIEFPAFPIKTNQKAVVFNAANPGVEPGLSGTNKALSESVTLESWKSTEPSQPPLQDGQATIGPWHSSPLYKSRWHSDRQTGAHWSHLGQVLAPVSIIHEDDMEGGGFQSIKTAYINALQLGLDEGCTIIQMPMLACGVYRPTDPDKAKTWLNMVMQAFCAAVLEIEANARRSGTPLPSSLQIIVIDYSSRPFKELMDWERN